MRIAIGAFAALLVFAGMPGQAAEPTQRSAAAAQEAREASTSTELTGVQTTPCRDVFFYGARGSGEAPGLGGMVLPTLKAYREATQDRQIVYAGVRYPARDVPQFNLFKWGPYFDGLSQGVSEALKTVRARHDWCPDERIVLAGYSQGAMVMHRVMRSLIAAKSQALDSIDGVILIADGDSVPDDRVTRYGTASAGHRGVGLNFPRLSGSKSSKFEEGLADHIHSICTKNDIVCDWKTPPPSGGIEIHESYKSGLLLKAAAQAVASETMQHGTRDAPAIVSSLLPAAQRTKNYTAILKAQFGSEPYRWRAYRDALPDGLTLDAAGVLSGVPTTLGTYSFRIRVTDDRGTNTVARVGLRVIRPFTYRWKSLATGYGHGCGIRLDDSLWCWGDNTYGQLGNGGFDPSPSPGPVHDSEDLGWQSVATGGNSTCALRSDNAVLCWGDGYRGQTGNGGTGTYEYPTVVDDADWSSVSLEGDQACGLRTDGSAWCWGMNWADYTGWEPWLTPTRIGDANNWLQIDAGANHACGLRVDHSLWCWGQGLDENNDFIEYPDPHRVGTDTDWASVSALTGQSSCALKTDDTLWCWGTFFDENMMVIHRAAPQPWPGSDWKSVSSTGGTVCAVKTDESVWCVGENNQGQMGIGEPVEYGDTGIPGSPVMIQGAGGISDWASVTVGAWFACGVRTDASGWCWGFNHLYQLGNGTSINRFIPASLGG